MNKYVDIDKLISDIAHESGYTFTKPEIISGLKDYPTADVKPVVRGKWYRHKKEIHGDTCFYCNACEHMAYTDGFEWELSDFCPFCGADMREQEARINKLIRDAQPSDTNTEIKITISDELKDYSE